MKTILTILAFLALSTGVYAQQWLTLGNAITDPNTEFLGTTSAQDIIVKTNNVEAMRILASDGNVGIGTATPANRLQVTGGTGSGVRLENIPNALSLGTDANGDIIVNNFAVHAIGDVKYAMLAADHDGWYKMDGLAYAAHSLPAIAISNADALGFGGSLPDANDKYLSQVSAGALGDISGNAAGHTITLTRANLPNVQIGGNTTSDGTHRHTQFLRTSIFNYGNGANGGYNASPAGTTTTPNFDGGHSHTILTESINGNVTQTDIDIQPATIKANAFVYLGN